MLKNVVLVVMAMSLGYWIESTRRDVRARKRPVEPRVIERWEGEGGNVEDAVGQPVAQPSA